MTDAAAEVPLPFPVEELINQICFKQELPPPDVAARRSLAGITEESAVDILKKIASTQKRINSLNGYIVYMVKKYGSVAASSLDEAESICLLPSPSPSSSTCYSPRKSAMYDSPTCKQFLDSPCYSDKGASPMIAQYLPFTLNASQGDPIQQLVLSSQRLSLVDANLMDSTPHFSDYQSAGHQQNQVVTSPGSSSRNANPNFGANHFYDSSSGSRHCSTLQKKQFSSSGPPNLEDSASTSCHEISRQSLILSELEFRKFFMVLSYVGSNKLEDVVSVEDAIEIMSMKNRRMLHFEESMWQKFGSQNCQVSDRARYLDWDSRKTHLYQCHVFPDGSYLFKGPYRDIKRTHLQRSIGDENVLIVKFADAAAQSNKTSAAYEKIAEAGILVGIWRYRFFVFKDGGKEDKQSGKEDRKKRRSSGAVKCYFVRGESIAPRNKTSPCTLSKKTTQEARCLFMHVHTVSSMAKYMARLSLILSTTIKLPVDLSSVFIEDIDDIPCLDENGRVVCDEDGERLIHTDGTGFISEDLAVLVPQQFYDAKFMKDKDFEKFDLVYPETESPGESGWEGSSKEPPLLIQCRLFNEGTAVKGTLLVNKKLAPRTIQVRPSMVKVKKDPTLSDIESFNSLEIVSVSRKPKTAKLSKYLIALLCNGGVPKEFFMDLLESTLKDAQRVCFDPRAAFRVANIYQYQDDSGTLEMFGACIPLNEPYFQYRLFQLANEERKGLGEGKLPISESFYLMGTTDPTGILNSDEVCVILENGSIVGKVLVYRNPGLHFGDIHVLNAVYVEELKSFIGNGKYAIFFSTKGKRNVANEIANGDFDGDLYWVSRNHQLLHYFNASEPWKRRYSTPSASIKTPRDYSAEELEQELVKQLFGPKTQSAVAGIAADSWMAYMDRFLTLQDDVADEKHLLVDKMQHLGDLYYDALDAPKSGKKVEIPDSLIAKQFPHYLGRKPEYYSTSVLGLIYDKFQRCKSEKLPFQDIWILPHFDVDIPDTCLNLWKDRYKTYRAEMQHALSYGDESKDDCANSVIKKYKQMLYDAPDFQQSTRNIEDLYNEALAIYHATYVYASEVRDVAKCGFAWKVAGSVLCAYHRKIHCMKTGERVIPFLPSSFTGVF